MSPLDACCIIHQFTQFFSFLDSAAFVKAKINNSGVLALGISHSFICCSLKLTSNAGYTQTLRPGVKASFGLALDTQRLNDIAPTGPAHKVGASLTFDA